MKHTWFIFLIVLLASCNNKEQVKDNAISKNQQKRITEKVLEHYPDGKKKVEGEKVNGKKHGMWKYYYKNGFLWSEGKFKYGERTGYSTVFYENGKKKLEGTYKKNLKVGNWKLWNVDGSLNQEINMDSLLTKEDSLKLQLN